MNGILIIDKAENFTSHDVVARCRRILQTKSIGHTGTLDPFATGAMVLLVGKATRLAQFLDKDAKEYVADVQFGFETDTGDRTGKAKGERQTAKVFSVAEIEAVLKKFRGEIEQIPPMYSAKKINGKKLYELARKGVEIERKPVKISIYELEIIEPNSDESSNIETQILKLKVSCSAGTYIRTLAEDIGKKLKIGAHLKELRRTKAGKFSLLQAVTLEKLEEIVAANKIGEVLVSMNKALTHLPEKRLDETEVEKVKNGMRLRFDDKNLRENQPIRLTDANENLIAVGIFNKAENFIQPKTVLM